MMETTFSKPDQTALQRRLHMFAHDHMSRQLPSSLGAELMLGLPVAPGPSPVDALAAVAAVALAGPGHGPGHAPPSTCDIRAPTSAKPAPHCGHRSGPSSADACELEGNGKGAAGAAGTGEARRCGAAVPRGPKPIGHDAKSTGSACLAGAAALSCGRPKVVAMGAAALPVACSRSECSISAMTDGS